ncbi:flagellar biosynthetic protein FliR [Holophaga foetida]|uniref:flagellar biosynthetic protein FliR n=1 Tax=Holophaga foetida TaxID=35839 RepID=UPI00024736F3|nr:flagellar biosynthetic protein FliR [Holophaga foetida]
MNNILLNPATWVLTQGRVLVWVLVLMRMTGLMASMPGLGQERVPVVMRAALAILMSMIIAPVVPLPKALPVGIWDSVGFMAAELAAGVMMGLMVSWIMEAVAFGGQLMDTQMGFSFVQIVDPGTSQSVSVSSTILMQLTMLFIFTSGLHHNMILALVESYRVLPMGQGMPSKAPEIVAVTGMILAKGVQLAAPVLLTLFLVDVLQGISAKFMPQLQLIQLTFPLKIALGLVVVGYIMRELGPWLRPLLEAAPVEALRLIHP